MENMPLQSQNMDASDLLNIISGGENSRVQLKENETNALCVSQEMLAFANSRNTSPGMKSSTEGNRGETLKNEMNGVSYLGGARFETATCAQWHLLFPEPTLLFSPNDLNTRLFPQFLTGNFPLKPKPSPHEKLKRSFNVLWI